jgi:hypothetical protein
VKTTWIAIAAMAGALVAGVVGLRSCQRAGWERTLLGPYVGLPFADALTNSPVSVLPLVSGGRLEVHEVPAHSAPVLALRSDAGAIHWSRLLQPERRLLDGRVEHAGMRQLRLERIERDRQGYGVFFTCDWDWGGKEGGLIDLDGDYGFKSFRIGW